MRLLACCIIALVLSPIAMGATSEGAAEKYVRDTVALYSFKLKHADVFCTGVGKGVKKNGGLVYTHLKCQVSAGKVFLQLDVTSSGNHWIVKSDE